MVRNIGKERPVALWLRPIDFATWRVCSDGVIQLRVSRRLVINRMLLREGLPTTNTTMETGITRPRLAPDYLTSKAANRAPNRRISP